MLAFLSCVVCKATHGILRWLNKGGTALPGTLALKICPDILKILAKNVNVLAVTGTNGKTTSVRMAEKALKTAGKKVFSNRSGANMLSGIVTAFAENADIFLRPECDWAVIECDEGYAPVLFDAMQPVAVLVTNLFKDQTDRYGGVLNTRDALVKGLRSSAQTILCVNADCPLTSSIADKVTNKSLYFGAENGSRRKPDESEGLSCLSCGARLKYRFVTYSNLGDFYCPKCGAQRRRPDTAITEVFDDSSILLNINGRAELIKPALPGLYNAYNAAGVICTACAVGTDIRCAVEAVSDFDCGFGRMERFDLGKKGARMILVKNTAAVNQTLDIIKKTSEPVTVVFAQNARTGDGKDLSWLYDADFEKLRRMKNVRKIVASGDCAEALAKRFYKAELSCELEQNYDLLLDKLEQEENYIFLLPSYTAMLDLRQKLIHRLGGKNFWE